MLMSAHRLQGIPASGLLALGMRPAARNVCFRVCREAPLVDVPLMPAHSLILLAAASTEGGRMALQHGHAPRRLPFSWPLPGPALRVPDGWTCRRWFEAAGA